MNKFVLVAFINPGFEETLFVLLDTNRNALNIITPSPQKKRSATPCTTLKHLDRFVEMGQDGRRCIRGVSVSLNIFDLHRSLKNGQNRVARSSTPCTS